MNLKLINKLKLLLFVLVSISLSSALASDKLIHTGYINVPDFKQWGFSDSQIIYEHEFYPGKEDRNKLIKPSKMNEVSEMISKKDGELVILDIEHWLVGRKRRSHSANFKIAHRYADTLNEMKKQNPDKKFGYFRVVPAWAHWDIISSEKQFNLWQRENDLRQVIANSADVLYPSLYTYHEDPEDWKLWAKTIIAKAREMANGKKVIPFIWPRFHQSSKAYKKGIKDLPAEYWRQQLELVNSMADGFVIWDGAGGNRGEWTPETKWWKETERFIQKNQANTN